MKHNTSLIILCILFGLGIQSLTAQAFVWNTDQGCLVDANGDCVPNTVATAVPFLRINPDARSGAMGDVGLGLSADPNALHFNASKLAFVDRDFSMAATYTPWLRELGLNDVYLAYLTAYKQIDELSTMGFGLRFFSLGDINFTDINGNPTGSGRPREIDVSFAYARKLTETFAMGFTGKYINSNLASGQQVGGVDITAANAFAADISFTYESNGGNRFENGLTVGVAIANIGTKVSYTNSTLKDFLPGNFGIGAAWTRAIDEYNSITFALDINKQLVPTPIPSSFECFDKTGPDGVPDGTGDFRQQGVFSGIFGSFADAPGGFSEELKEFAYSFGIEYWYDRQFAVRTGYYYENPLKGDRQFLTAGIGMKYNVFGLNLSYLVPTTSRRNPLDNTLRFTINFDFDSVGSIGSR